MYTGELIKQGEYHCTSAYTSTYKETQQLPFFPTRSIQFKHRHKGLQL